MHELESLAGAGEYASVHPSAAPARRTSRVARGGIVLGAGAGLAFLLMAHEGRLAFGVPLGAVLIGAAAWGSLDLAGGFEATATACTSVALRNLGRPIAGLLAALLLFCASFTAVARGLVPQWLGGAAVTASYVALVAAIFAAGRTLGPWARDEANLSRPLLRRHGFWLVVIAGVLYLPTLGASSLWDPWESQYSEVAREILVRDEWISLWWAHDGFFYSKPVLLFWAQAITMATLGVRIRPDEVLAGGAHPEWVVRLPNTLLAVFGLYVLYRAVAKVFGRRAGLFGALVLATCAHWFFLSRQATTDMTFVATMSASMGLLLLGLQTPGDAIARVYEVRFGQRTVRLSAWHLCFGVILACALPQAIYLLARNVDLVWSANGARGFRTHWDYFAIGSGGGNCGEPGNAACGSGRPAHPFEPFEQGLLWLAGTAALVWMNRNERRTRRLLYIGAWFFAAMSTLAKGPAGFGLPVLCALTYVATTKRWSAIVDMKLASGALIVAVVAFPWYVAEYVRHGNAFTDELIFHDMINRAFGHVHDTNAGTDTSFVYYVSQLGYGLFPWTGLAPLALMAWMRRPDVTRDGKGDASILLVSWAFFAFVLFTLMGTKFHHYIFPAVPPIALLIGIAIDDWLGRSEKSAGSAGMDIVPRDEAAEEHRARMLGAVVVAGALLMTLVGRDLAIRAPGESDGAIHFAQLFSYQYKRPWPEMLDFRVPLAAFACAAGLLAVAAGVRTIRAVAVGSMFALAAVFAVWCGDVYLAKTARHWGQGDVMRAYYASRTSEAEPLVAYQMNWKGENFYSGNHLAEFVSTGASFTEWIRERRDHGTKAVYVVLEHSRVDSLKREAGARAVREITDRDASHQFVLVRADL